MKVEINRFLASNVNTIGFLSVLDADNKIVFKCYTLELPYKNNARRLSSIPLGTYTVIKHYSPKFKKCFKVLNVINRSDILIHVGNYSDDTLGCILVGSVVSYNENKMENVVYNSSATLKSLLATLPDRFTMVIY